MAFKCIAIISLIAITYCVCHPVESRDVEESSVIVEGVNTPVSKRTEEEPLMDVLNSVVMNGDDHVLVKRSKRGGIIHGGNCPEGEGNLPDGECVPCIGRNLPGCPEVSTSDDYYDV